MIKSSLLILFISFSIFLFGQEGRLNVYDVNQIQGIWQMYANYTYPGQESFYKIFHIFNGRKRLTVDLTENVYGKFGVVVTKYGFSDSYIKDEICGLGSLKDTGTVFISMSENASLKDCFISVASIFELRPKKYLNLFSDECSYIDKSPKVVLETLYKRGQHDKRDYIQEFLGLKVCGIKLSKCFIFDSTLTQTNICLVKDDIVTVIGEKVGLIEMEYETANGNIIRGLIKKEALDCIMPR